MTEAGERRGEGWREVGIPCVCQRACASGGSNLGSMEASNDVVLVVHLAFERLDQLLKHLHLHAHTRVSNPGVHVRVYICVCVWVSECLQRKSCSMAGGSCSMAGGVLKGQSLKGQSAPGSRAAAGPGAASFSRSGCLASPFFASSCLVPARGCFW